MADYTPPVAGPSERFWEVGPVLNQGSTPHCVGFSFANWGNTLPVDDGFEEKDAHAIYYDCKNAEGRPGEEEGSTVRMGAKVMKRRGRINTYAFGSVDDAHRFILSSGPVVFGIDWFVGLYTPDANGIIVPSGQQDGGHAIMAYGATPEFCYFQNSWGESWGKQGCCKIRWEVLSEIFSHGGEVCAAVELPATRGNSLMDHVEAFADDFGRAARRLLAPQRSPKF